MMLLPLYIFRRRGAGGSQSWGNRSLSSLAQMEKLKSTPLPVRVPNMCFYPLLNHAFWWLLNVRGRRFSTNMLHSWGMINNVNQQVHGQKPQIGRQQQARAPQTTNHEGRQD